MDEGGAQPQSHDGREYGQIDTKPAKAERNALNPQFPTAEQ